MPTPRPFPVPLSIPLDAAIVIERARFALQLGGHLLYSVAELRELVRQLRAHGLWALASECQTEWEL